MASKAKPLLIRGWRCVETHEGYYLFFDPKREHVRLFEGPDPRGGVAPAIVEHVERELHGWVQQNLFGEEGEERRWGVKGGDS